MKKVRFGVIGIKGIGPTHIAGIQASKNAQLVALADIDEEAVKKAAKQYGVKAYTDYKELLKQPDIDAVCICTPHFLHAPMAIEAAKQKKHIFVEKPLAITVEQGEEMVKAARKNKVKMGIAFQYRTNPFNIATKRLLNQKAVGKIYRTLMVTCMLRTQTYYGTADWRGTWKGEGGGVLINQGVHYFDLFQWLVGMPNKVWARIDTRVHKIEVEDMVDVIFEYPTGARGYVHMCTVDFPAVERIEVAGNKGILVRQGDLKIARTDKPVDKFILGCKEAWATPKYQWHTVAVPKKESGHKVLISDFVRAILQDREPMINGEEGLKSLELINAIILSSCRNKVAELPVERKEFTALWKELCEKKSLPVNG